MPPKHADRMKTAPGRGARRKPAAQDDAVDAAALDAALRATLRGPAAPEAARGALMAQWGECRRDNDDALGALRQFVQYLRRQKRGPVARALLADLTAAMPGIRGLWALQAELASRAGRHAEALQVSQEIRARFPQAKEGFRGVLDAQLKLGDFAAAEATLAAMPPAMASANWALQAAVDLAERRQDYAAMLAAASALADRDAKHPDGLIGKAAALARLNRAAEAEAVISEALAKFPRERRVLRQAAAVSEQAGDLDAALQRWAQLRKHFPGTSGYLGALRTLQRLRRMDLAPEIVYEGLERFPDDIDLVVWAAELADIALNVDDGDYYWQRAVKLRPDNAQYALNAATTLLGKPSGRRKRMGEVMRRLEAHHQAFPDFAPAYTAHVNAYQETLELEEADRRSAGWCERFPDEMKLWLARAAVLEGQKRFGDALAVLARLRERMAPRADLEFAYGRALSLAGRHADGEAVVLAALEKDPAHRRLNSEYARIASRQGEWQLAMERLQQAQRKLPDDERIAKDLQNARLQLENPEADGGDGTAADNLFARFESLGGTGAGCEFGIVQRRMGNDSIGLLRWSRNDPAQLIAALDCEFDGVGEAENTELFARRVGVDAEEWVSADKRFLMESHTFVRTNDAPQDKMFTQTCRRLRFLRGKMLQDLRAAEKMYLFKALQPVDDETILALHAALARYGDNALLVVMRADKAAHKRGSVRELRRGVYAGYIGHFMKDDTGNPGFDITGWKTVCAEADARWQAVRPARAEAA